jgi:hypothetical protein
MLVAMNITIKRNKMDDRFGVLMMVSMKFTGFSISPQEELAASITVEE